MASGIESDLSIAAATELATHGADFQFGGGAARLWRCYKCCAEIGIPSGEEKLCVGHQIRSVRKQGVASRYEKPTGTLLPIQVVACVTARQPPR